MVKRREGAKKEEGDEVGSKKERKRFKKTTIYAC